MVLALADARREPGRSSPELVKLEFAGANPSARAEGLDPLPGKSNYFTGEDPKAWRTNVPTFARVRYAGVYPGVDLVYYGNQQRLEYDFIVNPGADVNVIRFTVKDDAGNEHGSLRIGPNGDLVIPTTQGEVLLRKPVVYQERAANRRRETGVRTIGLSASGSRRLVDGRYVLASAGEVSFQVGAYDRRQPLVIDPTLAYSSLLGGSGWDFGVSAGVAVDSAGNLYIASGTASTNFPGTSGGFKGASAGCNLGGGQICGDVVVTKINSSGTAIVYSTYLGGSGADGAYGLAVDGSGSAYLTGPTDSTDFPTTSGAFQEQFGGETAGCASAGIWPPCGDAFVTKLGPTGSTLVYSTYLGGSADDYAEAIAVDGSGNAYVTGQTKSANFPTTSGAFQETSLAGLCGTSVCGTLFVSKLNATGNLAYSTYVGGASGSFAAAIAVDTVGAAYVTGSAGWTDFPTTSTAYQPTEPGGVVFVKLDATGSSQLYSTYLGGLSSWEAGIGLAVDAIGNAYVGGLTDSPDFPVTAGAFQTSVSPWVGANGFVAKFDPSASGAASLVYSSFLEGGITAVAVDPAGNAYLAGGTTSLNFPTVSPLQGQLSADTVCSNTCGDGFVAVMDATGSQLLFSTYMGGTGTGYIDSLARDSAGNLYVGGGTTSSRFPTTVGAFQTTFAGGGSDMFVAKISPAPNSPAGSGVNVSLTSTASVTFENVTIAGTTAFTETAVGPATPAGFTLGTPAVYYDFSTTAAFSGEVTVCLSYSNLGFLGGTPGPGPTPTELPVLFHYENGNWVNVTTTIDFANEIVCGTVSSFSPFAVFGAVYSAAVQEPISGDGTSTFKAKRGSVPVKFSLSAGGIQTCGLPAASIAVYRGSVSSSTVANEDIYSLPSDKGSQFRIDNAACQYVYNLDARALGPGTYRVDIAIYGVVVGSARFALQ